MPGLTIKEPCCICGRTKEEGYKLQRFEGKSMIRIEDELRNINIKGENILNNN